MLTTAQQVHTRRRLAVQCTQQVWDDETAAFDLWVVLATELVVCTVGDVLVEDSTAVSTLVCKSSVACCSTRTRSSAAAVSDLASIGLILNASRTARAVHKTVSSGVFPSSNVYVFHVLSMISIKCLQSGHLRLRSFCNTPLLLLAQSDFLQPTRSL